MDHRLFNFKHKCWIFSTSSNQWYCPFDKTQHGHIKAYHALCIEPYTKVTRVTGVDEVSSIYQLADKRIPKNRLPNGVFHTAFVVDSPDKERYYIFTDVIQPY